MGCSSSPFSDAKKSSRDPSSVSNYNFDDLTAEIIAEKAKLTSEQRADFEKTMGQMSEIAEKNDLIHLSSTSSEDKSVHPFICLSAGGGFLYNFTAYKCVNSLKQVFSLKIFGIGIFGSKQLGLSLSANLGLGYSLGPVRSGKAELHLIMGAHEVLGGQLLVAENIRIISAGVGWGLQLSGGGQFQGLAVEVKQ